MKFILIIICLFFTITSLYAVPPVNVEKKQISNEIEIQNLKIENANDRLEAVKERVEDISASIDRFGILVAFFSVLVTAIVIYFSFKNTSEAKSVAQEEIQKWLLERGEEFVKKEVTPIKVSLNDTVDSMKKEILELNNKYQEEIDELKNQLNEKGNEVLDNLSSKISESSITEDNLSSLDKKYFESQIKVIKYKPLNKRTFQDYKKIILFYIADKDYEKADELLERVFKYNFKLKDKSWLQYMKGVSLYNQYSETNNPDKNLYNNALEYFDSSIELCPNFVNAYTAKAKIFNVIKQQYTEASSIAEKALKIDPYSYDAYISLGYATRNKAYFEEKSELYNKAIEYNKKAIEINPDLELAYNNIGSIYKIKNDYENALKWYEKSINASPNEWVYINILMIYLISNKPFPSETENYYIKNFNKNHEVIYHLLKILNKIKIKNITSEKLVLELLENWLKKNINKKIRYFSFRPVNIWVDGEKDEKIKQNLKNAINFFKKHRVKEEEWRE